MISRIGIHSHAERGNDTLNVNWNIKDADILEINQYFQTKYVAKMEQSRLA